MTTQKTLAPHVLALIQNVQLNEAGWADRGLRSLIISLVVEHDGLSPSELRSALASTGHTKSEDQIERNLLSLLDGEYLSFHSDTYMLLEKRRAEITRLQDEYFSLEAQARSVFAHQAQTWVPSFEIETLWESFQVGFLLPMAIDLGATTLQLFEPGRQPSLNPFREWVSQYAEVNHDDLRSLALAFFDPTSEPVRHYVLRIVDAALVVQSSGLTSNQLSALASQVKPHFALVLDTNFIFSLLGLHSNPANEVAEQLYSVRRRVKDFVDISFHVVPHTIREARLALEHAERECEAMHISIQQADAVLKSGFSFPGLVRRYLEVLVEGQQPITAQNHFGPYQRAMRKILESKHVEVSSEDLSGLLNDWFVRRDLDEQKAYYSRLGQPKQSGQIKHDVLLWHHVQRKRGVRAENAVEAKFWLLTVDRALVKFDRYRSELEAAGVPVCVHPSTILQMLEFWVPRSEELDIALMQSLKLPLLFLGYDRKTEEATLRLLQGVGRFQGEEELPEAAVVEFLMDQELRRRIMDPDNAGKEDALIENKLAELVVQREDQIKTLAKRVRELEASKEDLGATLAKRVRELEASKENLGAEKRSSEAILEAINRDLKGKEAEAGELRGQMEALAGELKELRGHEELRRAKIARWRFGVLWLGLPVAILCSASWLFVRKHEALISFLPVWIWSLGLSLLLLSGVAWAAEIQRRRRPELRKSPGLRRVITVLRYLGSLPVAMMIAVSGNWLWSKLQALGGGL